MSDLPVAAIVAFVSFLFGMGMAWGILGWRVNDHGQRIDALEKKSELIGRLDERTQEMNKKLDLLVRQAVEDE